MTKSSLTIEQILTQMDAFSEKYEYDEKTAYLYKSMVKAFFDFMQQHELDFEHDISNEVFNQFFQSRNNIKQRTKKMYIWVINEIFMHLLNQFVIDDNPMDNVRNLFVKTRGVKEQRLPVVLTKNEMKRLLDANLVDLPIKAGYVARRKQMVILLGVLCGLRNTEIRTLKIADLKINENAPHINVIGKYNKERIVPVPQRLADKIADFIADKDEYDCVESPYLLGHRKTGEVMTIQGVIKLVRNELSSLGIIKRKMTPHILRHTFCTAMLSSGVPLYKMMLIMGHSNMETTQIYEHVGMFMDKNQLIEELKDSIMDI